MKNRLQGENRLFRKFSLFTLIAVYLLILVGGIVRSTGSGMGCPDWPKCFGRWVPPTEVRQLPVDYKEIYSQKRAKKNVRFAKYLSALGFDNTAEKLLSDESILEESDFNATKTWIEYVNRLLGAIIGLLILGTLILSVPVRKKRKSIFYSALAAFILVVFQGWIGSIVVSTNLVPWMITIHMIIALIIVCFLINLVYRSSRIKEEQRKLNNRSVVLSVVILSMLLMLIQIVLGTQVREMIDKVAQSLNFTQRDSWVALVGKQFIQHRSFSWAIVLSHIALMIGLFKSRVNLSIGYFLMGLVGLSILTGIVMSYFGIPAFAQPIHLVLGTLIFGLQFYLFLDLMNLRQLSSNKV